MKSNPTTQTIFLFVTTQIYKPKNTNKVGSHEHSPIVDIYILPKFVTKYLFTYIYTKTRLHRLDRLLSNTGYYMLKILSVE